MNKVGCKSKSKWGCTAFPRPASLPTNYSNNNSMRIGGPAQKIPPKKKHSGGRPKFSKHSKGQKKRQTANKERLFFQQLNNHPPRCLPYPQPRWVTRSKFGDRHGTLNQFQRALTIAIFCFCCSRGDLTRWARSTLKKSGSYIFYQMTHFMAFLDSSHQAGSNCRFKILIIPIFDQVRRHK
jgi:hypothetical protein